MSASVLDKQTELPCSRFDALTPARCLLILSILLSLGFLSNVFYLTQNCPIDLSGDEAQYWDWSRRLDWCYYSKGPVTALIIRASCAIFGDNMPGVRFPALLLGVGTALTTYFLTRRLFKSDRLALGAVLLSAMVPLFIAGSILMTIDAPMFLAWALATHFAAIALFDPDKPRWPWIAMGLAIGIGGLAKYGALLWLPSLLTFLLIDPPARKFLRTPWPWITVIVALLCLTPCVIWNAQHDWVSFRHVATSTGASPSSGFRLRPSTIEFLASQIGVLGPPLFVLMIAAVIFAIRRRDDPNRRQMLFLASIGLTFFSFNLLDSLFAKTQVNWPAPAYFTLIILTAYFISRASWKRWRGWVYATIIVGIAMMIISRSETMLMRILKPVARAVNREGKKPLIDLANVDPLERVRGWRMLGDAITRQRDILGEAETFILCDDYQQTAEAAFYTRGQPRTYCAGPYFGKRLSQYDMWPDRRLNDNPDLDGLDAVYVGKGGSLPKEVEAAFERTERLKPISIIVAGVEVKSFKLWRCYGFKGFGTLAARDH
ncbi:MAG: glycosyltransferase family 39 protein [Anaerolineae bacterium]|nr:glycosyltransferase family 39 protein [Phycisphaerae bacterium]